MELLHPPMWHDQSWHWFHHMTAPCNVALESWQWSHQVAAPCNVICGSGMTCHWICPVAAPCNVTRSSGIMTLNSPGGSTLQCGNWRWDDMPLNSPKRLPYWNSTSGFWFWPHHRSRHVILHQSPKFYGNRTTLVRKNDVMPIFKMVDLSHLGF